MFEKGSALLLALITISLMSLLSLGAIRLLLTEQSISEQHKQYLNSVHDSLSIDVSCDNLSSAPFAFVSDTLDPHESTGVDLYHVLDKNERFRMIWGCRSRRVPIGYQAHNGEPLSIYLDAAEKHNQLQIKGAATQIEQHLKLSHEPINNFTPAVIVGTKALSSVYIGVEDGGFYRINLEQWPVVSMQYHRRLYVNTLPIIVIPYFEGNAEQSVSVSHNKVYVECCTDSVCHPLYEKHFSATIIDAGVHYGVAWVVLDTQPKQLITFDVVTQEAIHQYTQPSDTLFSRLVYQRGRFQWETEYHQQQIAQEVIIDAERLGRLSQWWLPK